ncbi:hypothetical protein V1L52_00990 [Treponema sp. HNW]|uniref:hypothetical protein n=1 Tax=Treponema sp. HNW TaxID=3116654 RepID=UPI003D0F1F53
MSDELAPEIAALLADAAIGFDEEADDEQNPEAVAVDPSSLKPAAPWAPVNLLIKQFQPVERFFSDTYTTDVFNNTAYYKTALSGEEESAQRLHNVLSKYLNCQDPKDRTVFRQQIVTAYWEFVRSLAPKMARKSTSDIKKMVLRYGVVLPSLFTSEQKDMFSKAIIENVSNEPVYYLDEWFRDIASGRIKISATDEAPTRKKAAAAGSPEEAARLMQLKTKNAGKLQSAENFLTMKESERAMLEAEIRSRIEIVFDHPPIIGSEPHKQPLSEMQKKIVTEINEKLRSFLKNDKELTAYAAEFAEAKEICNSLEQKIASGPEHPLEVSSSEIETEVMTVRQMAKMTVGRQGNQFPIFTREFFHCLPKETGFRENVIDIMTWIESVDPTAFCRVHKNVLNRIIPFVILIPTYGEFGFCWEPFDRYNRITSRGRIVIPMYAKSLRAALLMAVADLRWQVAKEKASYYWMEEGLTGQYYQWFISEKLKGDIKDYFIKDYLLWMTKESEGVQRLEKEIRGIFWRHMPFAQDVKEKLRTRSLVYQELYQRDLNRAMSDGY